MSGPPSAPTGSTPWWRSARLLAGVRVAGYPLALAAVAFVAVRAAGSVRLHRLSPLHLGLAVATSAASWLALARAWASLTGDRPRRGMAVWVRTQVLRYLPGAVLAPAARATAVPGRVRDKLATVVAEDAAAVAAALAVAGVLLSAAGDPEYLPLVLTPVALLLAAGWLQRRAALPRERLLRAWGWCLVSFSAFAVTTVMAQAAVGRAPDPLRLAGAACVAWVFGLVVVLAPGGMGARELAYVTLLHGVLPAGQLAAGALAARFAAVCGELLVLMVLGAPARGGQGSVRGDVLRGATPADRGPDDRGVDAVPEPLHQLEQ